MGNVIFTLSETLKNILEGLKERKDLMGGGPAGYLTADVVMDTLENIRDIAHIRHGISRPPSAPNSKSGFLGALLRGMKTARQTLFKIITWNYIVKDAGAEESASIQMDSSVSRQSGDTTKIGAGTVDTDLYATTPADDDSAVSVDNTINFPQPNSLEVASNTLSNTQDEIDDLTFEVNHGGLNREEWEEMLAWFEANGYKDIANALMKRPNRAQELLMALLDPKQFYEMLAEQAQAEYAEDAAAREVALQKIADNYAASYGLTKYIDYNGKAYYVDEKTGEYYLIYAIPEDKSSKITVTVAHFGVLGDIDNATVTVVGDYGLAWSASDGGILKTGANYKYKSRTSFSFLYNGYRPTFFGPNNPFASIGISDEEIMLFWDANIRERELFIEFCEAFGFNPYEWGAEVKWSPYRIAWEMGLTYLSTDGDQVYFTDQNGDLYILEVDDYGISTLYAEEKGSPFKKGDIVAKTLETSYGTLNYYGKVDGVDLWTDKYGNVYATTYGPAVRMGPANSYINDAVTIYSFGQIDYPLDQISNVDLKDKNEPPHLHVKDGKSYIAYGAEEVKTQGPSYLRDALRPWLDKMFIQKDGKYQYLSPRFFELLEKINRLYNIMLIIVLLVELRIKLGNIVLQAASKAEKGDPGGEEKSKFSMQEAIETRRGNDISNVRYQLNNLQQSINNYNNYVYQKKLQEAMKNARKKANKNKWNKAVTIGSLGASDIKDEDTQKRYYNRKANIDREYRDFQAGVEKRYEEALGKNMNFATSDPFGSQIDALMEEITFENLTYAPKEGMLDIIREQLLADRQRLTELENLRRIYYMLVLARQKLKEVVASQATGLDLGSEGGGAAMSALRQIEQLEQMCFAQIANRIQQVVASQNNVYEDKQQAEYWSKRRAASSVGIVPLVGPLLDGLLTFALDLGEYYSYDDANLGQGKLDVEKFIAENCKDKQKLADEILSDDEKAAQALSDLEKKEWETIAKLDEEAIFKGDDGFWEVDEAALNGLRDDLTRYQNIARMILLLCRAKQRLRELVAKIVLGKDVSGVGLDQEAFEGIFETRMLAFELKVSELQFKVQEQNRKNLLKRQAKKSLYQLEFTALAVVVAVAIAIATFGTGTAAAIATAGFIMAMARLGMAVGNILFNVLNPLDKAHSKGQEEKYYRELQNRAIEKKEKDTYDEVSRLYDEAREEIDKIDSASATYKTGHVALGGNMWGVDAGNMWGVDAGIFMKTNSALSRIIVRIKMLTMLLEARQQMQNIILAATVGVSADNGSDIVKAGMRATESQLKFSLKMKEQMVKDITNAHNREVAQKAELNRAIISAAISAASAAVGGYLGASGADQAAAKATEAALAEGLTEEAAAKVGEAAAGNAISSGIGNAMAVGNLVNSAVDLYFAWEDKQNAGRQSPQDEINAIAEQIYQYDKKSKLAAVKAKEREVVLAANNDLIFSTGGGEIAVDGVAFIRLRQEMEKIYNRYLLAAKAQESFSRFVKTLARVAGVSAGGEDGTATEAFYEAREMSLKNLDILRDRTQEYCDLYNQKVEYRKALFMAAFSFALQVILFFVDTLPKMRGETSYLTQLKAKLHDTVQKIFDDDPRMGLRDVGLDPAKSQAGAVIKGLLVMGDGNLGLSDLPAAAVDILTSDAFWQRVALFAAERTQKEKKGDDSKVDGLARNYSSSVDINVRNAEKLEQASARVESEREKDQKEFERETEKQRLRYAIYAAAYRANGSARRAAIEVYANQPIIPRGVAENKKEKIKEEETKAQVMRDVTQTYLEDSNDQLERETNLKAETIEKEKEEKIEAAKEKAKEVVSQIRSGAISSPQTALSQGLTPKEIDAALKALVDEGINLAAAGFASQIARSSDPRFSEFRGSAGEAWKKLDPAYFGLKEKSAAVDANGRRPAKILTVASPKEAPMISRLISEQEIVREDKNKVDVAIKNRPFISAAPFQPVENPSLPYDGTNVQDGIIQSRKQDKVLA